MSCNEVRAQLDDYVDGTLDPAGAQTVAAHLASCADCRRQAEELRDLLDRVATLPETIAPARDLWPEIAARIGEERVVALPTSSRSHRRWWLMAAAAVIATVSAVTAYHVGRWQGAETVATREPIGDVALASIDDAALADLHGSFAAVRGQLLAALEARRDDLSKETLAVVMDNLAVIDVAIGNITTALADHPGDPRLAHQLVLAYKREVALLQRAARLPAEI